MKDPLRNSEAEQCASAPLQELCSSDDTGNRDRDALSGALAIELSAALPPQASALPLTRDHELSEMSASVLADRCMDQISNYRRGEVSTDQYGVELFRRALLQGDERAREVVRLRFGAIVRDWIRRHPIRDAAYRLDSEENYVAQAFARFWQATVHHHQLRFNTLTAILRCLHVTLNGVILDTLRSYSRPGEMPLEPADLKEPPMENQEDSRELWEIIQRTFTHVREQRLAYLLYHCGLKPGDIIDYYPQEFSDVQEICRFRRTLIERLVHLTPRSPPHCPDPYGT